VALEKAVKLPLVYIQSASHSGSTMLAIQLARHPEVATVGELAGTPYRSRPGYQCSCGAELERCAFWRQVAAAMARRGYSYSPASAHTDIRNAPNPIVQRLLRPRHRGPLLEALRDAALAFVPGARSHVERYHSLKAALVESIGECTGKPVLVDSSKSGVQLKYHLRNPRLDVKLIWLVRDGRGVARSIARNQLTSLEQGACEWRRRNEEARSIVQALEASRWIQVRYEALCAEPEQTLARLWRFIGVAPQRVNGADCELHVLGHASRLKGAAAIHVNERWRSELSAADLRLFDSLAGTLNRELGYR
jgi:hypothetical protein